MSDAKPGNTVRIHYTGTLSDGSTFDTPRAASRSSSPWVRARSSPASTAPSKA
jgi:FKBP-type peptidyl-prolyl cis-trans isomerase 2